MNAAQLDENIIIRLGEGDKSAFRELYQQTSGAVYGFALSILKNKQDAEDVMHDTYIRAYNGAVSYRPTGKPLAWMLTIVRNLCYNKIRDNKICEDISQYDDILRSETGHDPEERALIEQAISVLASDERQIVILHAITGMKHREIAKILNVPTGTVLSKYNRALRKMKAEIERKRDI